MQINVSSFDYETCFLFSSLLTVLIVTVLHQIPLHVKNYEPNTQGYASLGFGIH